MKSIGVIPARLGSTRLPEKPLHTILGREMVLRVWDRAKRSKLDRVVVATDSEKICARVREEGGEAVMTSPNCATGTDRVLEALENLGEDFDIVFNIQGDEPLLVPEDVDALLRGVIERGVNMATLARPLEVAEIDSLDAVKVLLDRDSNAIYFSRWPIPFSRERDVRLIESQAVMTHIGIYAYRVNFLKRFCSEPGVGIERAESLEQLKALWMGESIFVHKTLSPYQSVDTPKDIELVEGLLRKGELDV